MSHAHSIISTAHQEAPHAHGTAAATPQRAAPQPGGGAAHRTDPQQVLPCPSAPPATGSIRARKPVGGFVFLTVVQLCLIWWAYRSLKRIQFLDLRVWFAAHELATNAKRCQLAPGQQPHYLVEELRKLLGWRSGDAPLRASIRRLEALGLLSWTSSRITFATSPADLQGVEDLSDFSAMLERITNNRRCIPVPRQTVRWIAQGGCRTIRLATLLGHLLRCLYYRDGQCHSEGRCKASWIATTFGVDRRRVRAERKHLLAIEWLKPGPKSAQSLLNRFGPRISISLTWTKAGLTDVSKCYTDVQDQPAIQLPPPPACTAIQLPPPCLDQEPLQEQEDQHQEPAQADPALAAVSPPPDTLPSSPSVAGVHHDVADHKAPVALPPPSPPGGGGRRGEGKAKPPIAARHFTHETLHDTAQLLEVYTDGVQEGLFADSEPNQLNVVGIAEHARRVATHNAPGLFATLLRRQHFAVISDADDEAAQARIKRHRHALAPSHSPHPPQARTAPRALSPAVCLVPQPLREQEEPAASDVRAAIEASLAAARTAIACARPRAAVWEPEASSVPGLPCAQCGRVAWWQPDGGCTWCLALALQARVEEKKRLYPVGQSWDEATAEGEEHDA
jgi:hypothetical protein